MSLNRSRPRSSIDQTDVAGGSIVCLKKTRHGARLTGRLALVTLPARAPISYPIRSGYIGWLIAWRPCRIFFKITREELMHGVAKLCIKSWEKMAAEGEREAFIHRLFGIVVDEPSDCKADNVGDLMLELGELQRIHIALLNLRSDFCVR